MSRRITPLYVFDDPAEYYRRHSQGTLVEFQNESKEINAFNEKQTAFKAWVVANVWQAKDRSAWIFLVRPGEQSEWCFPKEGESCEFMLLSKSGNEKKSQWWDAERVDNPAASMGLSEEASRLAAFQVKVPNNISPGLLRPLQDDPDDCGYDETPQKSKKYLLSDKKAVRINIKLKISSATKDAEFGAITKLALDPEKTRSQRQHDAFLYLMDFQNPRFEVSLFNHFPHLQDPMNTGALPAKVITMLKGYNEHQISAYRSVLGNLPCGICIIPGGPGAGKTHWNLVLTTAIQSKNEVWMSPTRLEKRPAKVLYILDINKPLDDTSNKMVRLYKSLGLKKHAVRLYGWHYKGAGTGNVDFSSKFLFTARLNRYRKQTFNESCLAPTLDELAWDAYDSQKRSKYSKLCSLLSKTVKDGRMAKSDDFKDSVNDLYRDVLSRVDFIATTPVPAATGFDGYFRPDIVIFDESPHAREASTMVAIAQFEPIAWIFSGDHRQTRPFVASDDVRDNPWVPQMLVSMMERADRAGAVQQSLLINHRAYGGLQRLASGMFYNMKMISGHPDNKLFPPSVQHLQRYLERFMSPGQTCGEPRLIAFSPGRSEIKVGTSWYNENHGCWVMERVTELLQDACFRQVGKTDRGTILIIAPYKEAYMKYRKSIKNMPQAWQARLGVETRLEARTIDTVQGGEADFVFLDLVRSQATEFTDDPNRLCVALTRARQAEVILMHPGMSRNTRFLSQVFAHCEQLRQIATIGKPPAGMAAISNRGNELAQNGTRRLEIGRERAKLCPEPESIYASEFAIAAKAMEEILAANAKKHVPRVQSGQSLRIASKDKPEVAHAHSVSGPLFQNGPFDHPKVDCGRDRISTQDEKVFPASRQDMGAQNAKAGLSKDRDEVPNTSLDSPATAAKAAQNPQNRSRLLTDMASRQNVPRSQATPHNPTAILPAGILGGRSMGHDQNIRHVMATAQTQPRPRPTTPIEPAAVASGKAREKETSSLPAGQPWW